LSTIVNLFTICKDIHDKNLLQDYRRKAVFVVRGLVHQRKMQELITFFCGIALRKSIAEAHPSIFEQVTRCVLYRNSTFSERLAIIKQHFQFSERYVTEEGLRRIYLEKGLLLWKQPYHEGVLSASLTYGEEVHKEGLMAVTLMLDEKVIYRVNFYIAADWNGELGLWIGALQGSPNGLTINHELTKHFYGYRPKNLMLHFVRAIASQLSIHHIYAVSNSGFYRNNHIRVDRKLKTSLDEFWSETGGKLCSDLRFYELPLTEPRKSMDEVKSHKRNLYKKRFETMETINDAIQTTLASLTKPRQKGRFFLAGKSL